MPTGATDALGWTGAGGVCMSGRLWEMDGFGRQSGTYRLQGPMGVVVEQPAHRNLVC